MFCAVPSLVVVNRSVLNRKVRKTAQGGLTKSVPKPEELSWVPEKRAENSRERPGPYSAIEPALTPSRLIVPPATMRLPLGESHWTDDMLAGSESPENSAPNAGARITSPSVVSEM